MMSQEANDLISIRAASTNILNLDIKLTSKLRNCNPEAHRMTPCVMDEYDKLFGKHYNMAFKKNLHLIDTVTSGVTSVTSVTGCLQPCHSYQYPTHVYLSYHQRFSSDIMTRDILDSTRSNSSSMIVIDYFQKETIIKVEELPRYTVISFISDVGGILGIFLGVSFWSIYDFVAPILQKLVQNQASIVQTIPPLTTTQNNK